MVSARTYVKRAKRDYRARVRRRSRAPPATIATPSKKTVASCRPVCGRLDPEEAAGVAAGVAVAVAPEADPELDPEPPDECAFELELLGEDEPPPPPLTTTVPFMFGWIAQK